VPRAGLDLSTVVREWHKEEVLSVLNLAQRIKKERVMWGMTQEELSEATGIERSKIAKIETGAREAAIEELSAFAGVFQLSVDELVSPPRPAIHHRIDMSRRETQQAVAWFDRCIDNSLFVRRVERLYERAS